MASVDDLLDDPDSLIVEIGIESFVELLDQAARRIAGKTPLDSDSWDDPEEWQLEGAALAHGYEALNAYLRMGGLPPSQWQKKG